jgi:hypothetical protein
MIAENEGEGSGRIDEVNIERAVLAEQEDLVCGALGRR